MTVPAARRGAAASRRRPITSPTQVSGLYLWFDASQLTGLVDGDPVTTFTDMSGGSRSLTSSGTRRPTYKTNIANALPVVRFDGVDDRMMTPTFTSQPQPNTIFAVASVQATTSQWGNMFDGSSSTTRHAFGRITSQTTVAMWSGTGLPRIAHAASATPALWGLEYRGTLSRMRRNGLSVANGDAGTNAINQLVMGDSSASSAAAHQPMPCDMAEFLFYDSALSEADTAAVEAYLAAKWGLTLTPALTAPTTIFDTGNIQSTVRRGMGVSIGAGGTWKATQVREHGNVIEDPSPTVSGRRWLFPYAGYGGSLNVGVGMSFSPTGDGADWTDYASNPVVALGEDPYIAKDITTGKAYRDTDGLHMFSESKTAGDTNSQYGTNHHTSLDGITWTADPANPVFSPVNSWEINDVTSPVVFWTGTEFVLVYEGRSPSNTGRIGVARSSTLTGANWTRDPNPIISQGATGTWRAGAIVPDDIFYDGTSWVLTVHGVNITGWCTGRFITTVAPASWTSSSFAEMSGNPFDSIGSTVMSAGSRGFRCIRNLEAENTYFEFVELRTL